MRTLAYAGIAAALIAIQSHASYGLENKIRAALVEQYRTYVLLEQTVRDRCVALMHATISSVSISADGRICEECLRNVDVLMRMHGCLDRYSRLLSITRKSGASEKETARLVVHERHLVVRIPEFKRLDQSADVVIAALGPYTSYLKNIVAIVIDVRDNPGGNVDDLRKMAALFAPAKGLRYMDVRGVYGVASHQLTERRGVLAGIPLRILIDGYTASASEWLIAILKDWYPRTVYTVGVEATSGKSVIQCIQRVENIVMQLTCARWKFNGDDIEDKGISPDWHVDLHSCGSDYSCVVKRISRESIKSGMR